MSPVGRNPSEMGRRSWAKRPQAERERRLKILLAAADHRKGGQAMARLLADPEFRTERMRSGMIEEARRKGWAEPLFFKYVPAEFEKVRRPGRMRKKRDARAKEGIKP